MAASNSPAEQLITDNIGIWTSAIKKRGSQGRGSSNKTELYGIKKLRELILELAVRGLLVPQDPNDEPASVLLEKIAAEKEQLIKDGKIKKRKALPEISEDEKPFELPNGWEWCRLPSICNYNPGKTPSTKNSRFWADEGDGIPWISIADMQHHQTVYNTSKTITSEAVKEIFKKEPIKAGTLIMSFKLTLGKISKIGIDAFHNEAIISITPFSGIFQDLIYHILPNRALAGNAKKAIKGNTLNSESLSLITFPLPPEAEQPRIVAKVDELMALCDQLEQQTESSLTAHQTLVETLLSTLLNADQNRFDQAWERIAQHFDVLFTTEHSIDQLKQTILQLAVMGKLVPQDPNDEPASVLLEKIATEKEQLIKDKVIKKQKPLPPISEDEKPFELPKGWEWVRFASLSNEIATGPFGSMIHKRDYIEGGVPLINPSHMINSRVVEDSAISVSAAKSEELRSYKLYENDIVMARRGEMGRCALITKREENWLCGTGSFVLRFNDKLSRDYILLLFRTRWVKEYLGGESIGTTMTNLNHNILNRLPLLLPPLAEVPRIISRVSELMDLCEMLKKQISESRTTQLHLADAMAGQALN